MAKIISIVKEPSQVLRKEAKALDPEEIRTPKIKKLISNMKEILKNTVDGVGLAAPQVGESLQIFIVSEESEEINKIESGKKAPLENYGEIRKQKEWKNYVFINPAVKNISKNRLERAEGCLSVPGEYGIVRRNEKITIEAYDENGKKFTRGASGFVARVIQHELDHLKGTLFIDKAEKMIEPYKK